MIQNNAQHLDRPKDACDGIPRSSILIRNEHGGFSVTDEFESTYRVIEPVAGYPTDRIHAYVDLPAKEAKRKFHELAKNHVMTPEKSALRERCEDTRHLLNIQITDTNFAIRTTTRLLAGMPERIRDEIQEVTSWVSAKKMGEMVALVWCLGLLVTVVITEVSNWTNNVLASQYDSLSTYFAALSFCFGPFAGPFVVFKTLERVWDSRIQGSFDRWVVRICVPLVVIMGILFAFKFADAHEIPDPYSTDWSPSMGLIYSGYQFILAICTVILLRWTNEAWSKVLGFRWIDNPLAVEKRECLENLKRALKSSTETRDFLGSIVTALRSQIADLEDRLYGVFYAQRQLRDREKDVARKQEIANQAKTAAAEESAALNASRSFASETV